MAIPAGTPVIILPIQARGCANFEGVVMECCEKLSCLPGPGGGIIATTDYLVRYYSDNCNQCGVLETRFCEADLAIIPPPPAP